MTLTAYLRFGPLSGTDRTPAVVIGMLAAIIYWFVHVDIAVADLQIETAVRIGADPGFVLNARTLAAEV